MKVAVLVISGLTVPRGERGQVRRDADRDARQIVDRHRGQIRRDAETLERRGTL